MSLDALFGTGTAAAFATKLDISTAVPGASVTVSESTEVSKYESVGVEAVWTLDGEEVAKLMIEAHKHWANYTLLNVQPAFRGKGIYQALILQQPQWWASLGVPALVASPRDPRAEYILALGGFHRQELRGYPRFAALTSGDRMEEYAAWLTAGRPEETQPVWHAELAANPVPGEAEF